MLPVALALAGTQARLRRSRSSGWFGPRGLASIVFTVHRARGGEAAARSTIASPSSSRSCSRSTLHGISARPLTDRYARWYRAHARPPAAMESVYTPARWRRTQAVPVCRGPRRQACSPSSTVNAPRIPWVGDACSPEGTDDTDCGYPADRVTEPDHVLRSCRCSESCSSRRLPGGPARGARAAHRPDRVACARGDRLGAARRPRDPDPADLCRAAAADSYNAAVDGVPITPRRAPAVLPPRSSRPSSSRTSRPIRCGRATASSQLEHGLRACWSTPILDAAGRGHWNVCALLPRPPPSERARARGGGDGGRGGEHRLRARGRRRRR